MGATVCQFGCMPSELMLPSYTFISNLIKDIDVSASDVNSLLFILYKLDTLEKLYTLIATLMPVWLTA
jgi:hypothetical protein